MRAVLVFASLVWACKGGMATARNGSRYWFYRSMKTERRGPEWAGSAVNSRRVFGGQVTALKEYPAACVLLDRYWTVHCSGAVVAKRWALTAAHCVSPQIAYVKFNSQHPSMAEGNVSAVQYLYRHPGYEVRQEDEGRGVDVTLLHHDIGLVRTRNDMTLAVAPSRDPLHAMRLYNPRNLNNEIVQVLGFGRTEKSMLGEELFEVNLTLVFCERNSWVSCMCGMTVVRAGDGARGVCSGDSGGPVLYRGVQVGVTSMGPLECAESRMNPGEGATSVFTTLYTYADLVNATIYDMDEVLHMRIINMDGHAHARHAAARLVAAAAAALLTGEYWCSSTCN